MPEWDWQPPGGGPAPGADLEALAAADELGGWPEWLGGPAPEAPVDLAEPAPPLPAPDEPVAPPEQAPAPEETPGGLPGPASAQGLVARFPWEVAEPMAPADAAALELDALTGGTPEAVADPFADPRIPREADASYDQADADAIAEQRRLAGASDVELAVERSRRDEAWRQRQAELRAEFLAEDKRRQRENAEDAAEVREQARRDMAEIHSEATELAQAEVDPGRWWANADTSQKIGAGIAAVLGGFMSPHQGGRNTGIEFIERLIDRDIAAQRENLRGRREALNLRRGLVGDLVDLGMGDVRAAEVARQAAWQTIELEIGVEQAKFEQGGTAWLRHEEAKRAAQAAQQKAAADAYERNVRTGLAIKGDARADEQLRQQYGANIRADARARDRLKWEREKYGLDQQAAEAAAADERQREQRPLGLGQPGELVNDDGSAFAARSTTARERLALQKAATDTMGDIITRIIDDRRKFGWGSDLVKSGEVRRMKANLAALMLAAKDAAKLGALSGPDIELVEKFIGTGDPTELRDPTEGLLTARRNFELGFDKALRAEGYTGPEYTANVSDDVRLMRAEQQAEAEAREFERRVGMSEDELARDYAQHVERAKRDGAAPMTKPEFAAEAARQWDETQRSLKRREDNARGADADSDVYDSRPRQRF